MAIGTDIKIGWDATAAKSGLTSLKGMFTGAMRGVRQVGIGAARQMGTDLVGILKDALLFIPNELEDLRKLSNEMGNLSTATGESFREIARLGKALELGGFENSMATEMLRELNTKLGEAQRETGGVRDALHDLNMRASDFKGRGLNESMRMLADAVATFRGSKQDLAYIFDRLLGGDLGAKAVPFFKDFSKWMGEAKYSSTGLANALEEQRESLNLIPRLGAAIRTKWREALLAAFGSTNQLGSHSIGRQLIRYVEGINVSGLKDVLDNLFKEALRGGEWFMTSLKEKGFGATFADAFTGLTEKIQAAIAEGVKMGLSEGLNFWKFLTPTLPSFPGLDIFKGLGGAAKKADTSSTDRKLDQIASLITGGNRSLMKIENLKMGWA